MIGIDFESYYAKDFTLSKLTVEEYVRDPRFQTIGVSIKRHDAKAVWYPRDEVADALTDAKLEDHEVLAHNAMFDGFILNEVYGIRPGFWLDTLSMARALHQMTVGGSLAKLATYYKLPPKGDEVVQALGLRYEDFGKRQLAAYGRYCCNDNEITVMLFEKLMEAGFPQAELASIDQTIRMFTEPKVELNGALLQQHLLEERARKDLILHTVLGGAPTEEKLTQLRSNQQFAEMLKTLGVEPPQKISKTTGKLAFAFAKTDEWMVRVSEDDSHPANMLVRARMGVKSSIEETRAERLIGVSERGALPVDLNYYGAHTGRYSGGSKLNIQNLPSRSGSNNLRNSLVAPKDHVFISADSSQIEARLVAWLAGQQDLTQAFADGRDVYCEFAGDIFGGTVTKKNKDERFVGKTGILSLGYGAGGPRFQDMLRVQGGLKFDAQECTRIVALYRQRYPKIPMLWRRASVMLQNMLEGKEGRFQDLLDYDRDGIMLPSGLRIQYPGLSYGENDEMRYLATPRAMAAATKARVTGTEEDADAVPWTKIYGGKCIENIVQALMAIIMRWQARIMRKKGHHMVFQVHDDLVFLPRFEDAAKCAHDLNVAMHRTPSWAEGLPLACELKVGETYGSMRVITP